MPNARDPQEPPPRFPPGTQVGPWRVVERRGQGAYGAVYRTVRVGQEDAGPVALKLSLRAWDQRIAREAELLSRLRHPGIARLLDRGTWCDEAGWEHPWFVMEWVEGTPLYEWAERHEPSSREVCRVLAQLARALEAVHGDHAVHRDIKGDNVLVRHVDGRAMLIDFGSCHYQGAERLTWQSLPPGTPAYFSPEMGLFYIRAMRDPDAYYPPAPADDVYALGVTAYRLVMGKYPPPLKPHEDEAGAWHVTRPDVRPLLEKNSWVGPRLRELILRMLSSAPEARGTAAELAQALEAVADSTEPVRSRRALRAWGWASGSALAAAGVTGLLLWSGHTVPGLRSANRQEASDSAAPEAGTTAVGDTAPTAPKDSAQPPSEQKSVAQNRPFDPRPGQTAPDSKGRCPGQKQVVIKGACWVEIPATDAKACAENGFDFLEGRCYAPVLVARAPQPTSNPADAR
ncbi:MAG TPA: serine/threonine-protein kinase [Myxococcaceae bacterium]|nr:serine/threonine-protein kinase [Myxococcaceae bacterium]